ncbi:hypothetical protein [Candidatus Chlorobium masyuteum]|nr:hypothetical protein [Candidatus Chlorobium masyuteum]
MLAKWLIDSLDELPEVETEALWIEKAQIVFGSFIRHHFRAG